MSNVSYGMERLYGKIWRKGSLSLSSYAASINKKNMFAQSKEKMLIVVARS